MRLAVGWLMMSMMASAFGAEPPSFGARFEQIRDSATNDELYRFLWAMPKGGDLHNHHEYSVPPEEWLRVALAGKTQYLVRTRVSACGAANEGLPEYTMLRPDSVRVLPECVRGDFAPLTGLSVAQRAAWVSSLKLDLPGEGRDEFFERLVLRTADLENDPELVTELLVVQLRQAAAEGTAYVETQADPRGFVRRDGSPMPWAESSAMFRQRLAQRDAESTEVTARLQVAVLRFSATAEDSLTRAFQFVHQNRDLWVAVNLVGREDNAKGRAARFTAAFAGLRRQYPDVRLSLHAGESEREGREVRDALALGAERIGHGTNLISDGETMWRMSGGRVLMEVSLVSNQLLGYVPDPARHPLPQYLRAGIPVCLNTDDRGAFDSNLTDEYFLAAKRLRLSWDELVRMGRDSLAFSFAEPALKERLLAEYHRRVREFERRMNVEDWRGRVGVVRAVVSGYAVRHLGVRGRDMIAPSY